MVTLADRISGALLAHAAGDCLGAPVEFLTPERIAATYGTLTDIVGGGVLGWRQGQGTDDTDQTLAVADAYLAGDGRFDIDDIAGRLLSWYRSGPRDIGTTTRKALRRLAAGVAPAHSGCQDDTSIANGSQMRALLPGITHRDHPDERHHAATALSAITHAHPLCTGACDACADIVSRLLCEQAPHEALAEALHDDGRPPEIREALADATDGLDNDMTGTGGAVDGFRLAAASLVAAERDGLEAVLIDVVNRGGDADTNAAIAGGLLGVRHGRNAIPGRWIEQLYQRSRIETLAAELAGLPSTGRSDP